MADSCRRVLAIEIPSQVVRERAQAVARELQRAARLPGFRPGKAPVSVIEQRFQEDIRSRVLQQLVPEYIAAAAREQNWEPVGTPAVTDVHYEADAPLQFKATVEILPEFELADYRSLRVEVEQATVAEEEVEQALERLREQSATYVNVDPRPLRDGDFAAIAMRGAAPGKESADVRVNEVLCEIGGPNTVREFTDHLRGAQVGEELAFEVAYARDHGDPRLAGKSVSYHVKVLGIKQKHLPELTDDFARELGDFESLDAVRQHIREDLRNGKLQEAEQNARSQARQQLVALHDFPVPESLVERQIERRLERLRRQLASQGVDPQSLALDWGKVRAAQREGAVEDVKSTFLLEKIAHREQLEPDESEVSREIARIASATRQDPEAVRSRLTSEGGLDRMKSRLRIEKALDFVFQQARKAG